MKKMLFMLVTAFFCSSCGIDAPEPDAYAPFRCIAEPEERIYFPEENWSSGSIPR